MSSTGGATVTYFGHSTVAIDAGGSRLLTDPLLRGSLLGFLRRRRPLPPGAAVGAPDAVLLSHLHYDHLDIGSLSHLPPGTPIVCPRGAADFLQRRGFARTIELAEGQSTSFADALVTAVRADHDPGGRRGAGGIGSLGYVIEADTRIYFAGDTGLFDGMSEIGRRLDLALLPIWGWGPVLGPGHLDPETAAEALAMLKPRAAIPIHWGTYTPIGARRLWPWMHDGPARRFAENAARAAPEVDIRILEPGESFELARRGGDGGG